MPNRSVELKVSFSHNEKTLACGLKSKDNEAAVIHSNVVVIVVLVLTDTNTQKFNNTDNVMTTIMMIGRCQSFGLFFFIRPSSQPTDRWSLPLFFWKCFYNHSELRALVIWILLIHSSNFFCVVLLICNNPSLEMQMTHLSMVAFKSRRWRIWIWSSLGGKTISHWFNYLIRMF